MQTNWAYWIAGQAGVVPLALGMPGVANTESARAFARAAGRMFLPVMLDQILPEDLGGYPVVKEIQHDGRTVEVMRRVLDEKFVRARLEPSVMLIDELTVPGSIDEYIKETVQNKIEMSNDLQSVREVLERISKLRNGD